MEEYIRLGLTAEAAVLRVQSDNRARMLRQPDPWLRARLHDLDDLSWRLLRILASGSGDIAGGKKNTLPPRAIIFARAMGPAELLDYDHHRIAALVLEEGAHHAHVTLLARALELPMVAAATAATDLVEQGDTVIVDAHRGEVHIRPDAELLTSYRARIALRDAARQRVSRLKDAPPTTKDGERIRLLLNAGLLVDLEHLDELGVEGIGLFRTEMHFLMQQRLPTRSEQEEHYRAVLAAAGKQPVVFRTLDIGADKLPMFVPDAREPNPAMGWRAIRIGLDRPGLLKMQLRALLTAAAGRELHIMFPFIADIGELRLALELLATQKRLFTRLRRDLPTRVHCGVMLEVPSLLWQLQTLLSEVDFISIGTNDLMQFVFAADRANPRTARRFDPLHPAMLRLLRDIAEKTHAMAPHLPLTVCGDMAADPLEAMMLLGLGFSALSMPPAAIGPVRAMVCTLPLRQLRAELSQWLAQDAMRCSLREEAARFARAHGVEIIRP